MLTIAVCDNEKNICIHIERLLDKLSLELGEPIETRTFTDGQNFYESLCAGWHFDAVVLDIELGAGMNGIEICHRIRSEGFADPFSSIVLISGKEGYEKELIQLYPLYFLNKPFDYMSFSKVMKTALKVEAFKQRVFEYTVGHVTKRIPMKQILYFESNGRKVCVTGIDREDSFYGTLTDVDERVKGLPFLRIHESYLVNINFIESIEFANVILCNNKSLPISQSRQKVIRHTILELYGE